MRVWPGRPYPPMIILPSPKGWTAPGGIGGHKLEGFWRAHQVPITDVAKDPSHLKLLEEWMRSYKPEELFDETGQLLPALRELSPKGSRRMDSNPHANGGLLREDLGLPDFRNYGVEFPKPGQIEVENTRPLGGSLRDVMKGDMQRFRVFGPDENTSNKLDALCEITKKTWLAHLPSPESQQFHVRGYKEQGNINTPFELAIRNQVDRYSIAIDAIDRVPKLQVAGAHAKDKFRNEQIACCNYAYENGIDKPEIVK
jgi:phosphoketolase